MSNEYFKACNEFVILTNEYESLYRKGITKGNRVASLERKISKLSKFIEDCERVQTISGYHSVIVCA